MTALTLVKETTVIGIGNAIIGLIISTVLMILLSKDFTFKKYSFWPQVMLGYFITGILIHLIYEFSGGNKWYCKYGNACQHNE